jgi:membrane protein implicated in regulation of membrane protease activity
VGAGGGAILRGSLTVVIAAAGATNRAGALATFFTAAYVGLALPVLGLGIALQFLTPRVTLLIFAMAVGLGILAAAPFLARRPHQGGVAGAPLQRSSEVTAGIHGAPSLGR